MGSSLVFIDIYTQKKKKKHRAREQMSSLAAIVKLDIYNKFSDQL